MTKTKSEHIKKGNNNAYDKREIKRFKLFESTHKLVKDDGCYYLSVDMQMDNLNICAASILVRGMKFTLEKLDLNKECIIVEVDIEKCDDINVAMDMKIEEIGWEEFGVVEVRRSVPTLKTYLVINQGRYMFMSHMELEFGKYCNFYEDSYYRRMSYKDGALYIDEDIEKVMSRDTINCIRKEINKLIVRRHKEESHELEKTLQASHYEDILSSQDYSELEVQIKEHQVICRWVNSEEVKRERVYLLRQTRHRKVHKFKNSIIYLKLYLTDDFNILCLDRRG